jgi:YrbI family 3-deoxy-D-manno-octulosonate 8-phosphate phosphatase
MKKFNTRDGVGLRLLKERGVITAIITGESSLAVGKRGEKLGVDEILLGIDDKLNATLELCKKYGVEPSETAYVGDDINDLEALKAVGLAICPADAAQAALNVAAYVSAYGGGHGAVRDAAEYVLGGHNAD